MSINQKLSCRLNTYQLVLLLERIEYHFFTEFFSNCDQYVMIEYVIHILALFSVKGLSLLNYKTQSQSFIESKLKVISSFLIEFRRGSAKHRRCKWRM